MINNTNKWKGREKIETLRCRCGDVLFERLKERSNEDIAKEYTDHHENIVLESSVFVYFGIRNVAFILSESP